MPLNAAGLPGLPHNDRMAVGFWMTCGGSGPPAPIRVFVTYEALAQMDPTQARDQFAALRLFMANRAVIEAAASRKFDAKGVDGGTFEGQPVLTVYAYDLPSP